MCKIFKAVARATGVSDQIDFISNLFGGGDKGPDPGLADLNARLAEQNKIAQDSAAAALEAQKDAQARATAASVPLADSESARLASEARMRKLIAANAPLVNAGKLKLGDAPVGYRMLSGS